MIKKKYSGPLETPLPVPPTILGARDYKAEREAYVKEVEDRVRLLMKHYGIDPNAASCWRDLAISLAQEHVPGLRPWVPSIDTERHVRVLLRMQYLVKVLGFTEKAAANALQQVDPELGEAEAVRSIYREQEVRPNFKSMRKLLDSIEHHDPAAFKAALEAGIGPDVDKLTKASKPSMGRPPKK